MHELRKDILLGRWVAVLSESLAPSEYNLSPNNLKDDKNCILCPGRESEIPSEITSIRKPGTNPDTPGWLVKAGWLRPYQALTPCSRKKGILEEKALVYMTK